MIALAQHPSTVVLIPGKGGDPVTLLPTRLARQYVTGVHNSFVGTGYAIGSLSLSAPQICWILAHPTPTLNTKPLSKHTWPQNNEIDWCQSHQDVSTVCVQDSFSAIICKISSHASRSFASMYRKAAAFNTAAWGSKESTDDLRIFKCKVDEFH